MAISIRNRKKNRTTRIVCALILVLCALALAAAEYMQLAYDLAPCPLCVMQRYAFWIAGLVALAGVLRGRLSYLAKGFGALASFVGVGVAAYHVSILLRPAMECGIDPVENFINRIPLAQLWPQMFAASGFCNAQLPLIFGISIPMWSLIYLLAISALWFVGFKQKHR